MKKIQIFLGQIGRVGIVLLAALMVFTPLNAATSWRWGSAHNQGWSGVIGWSMAGNVDHVYARTATGGNYGACLRFDYRTKKNYTGAKQMDGCVKAYTLQSSIARTGILGAYSRHKHTGSFWSGDNITSPY
ncbi:hypothetical protein AwErysi_07730 [Erysipelotrichaceae bacterium]|nr:hypothetical protein AwErysi_07730 [Erysipelotrichaceae bacterium]